MKKTSTVIAAFSAILVLALTEAVIVIQANANPTWHVQVVDPRGSGGQVIIDSHDNPHIIYVVISIIDDSSTTSMNYAQLTDKKWNIEHLNYTAGNIFIMDTNNNPHVISTSNGTLKDIPLTTPVWNIKDTGIAEVAGDTRALDSSGTLHEISSDYIYFESNNSYTSRLYYTTWTKSGVSVQIISEANSTAQVAYQRLYPKSIAVDSKGNPHIIFGEEHETVNYPLASPPSFTVTSAIKYAVWAGSNWAVQTLATDTDYWHGNLDFVLDSEGKPHLCYLFGNRIPVSSSSYTVKTSFEYIYFDGLTWVNQTIEPESGHNYYGQLSLRLDSNDNPQLYYFKENYQETTDSGLIYANLIDSDWNLQIIGSYDFNDIAFDSYGNPHIIYDMWLGGSIRGAPIPSNLTYASLVTTPVFTPTLLLITISVVAVIVIGIVLLVNFKKRKH
jgi:hypothetical protein